MSLEHQYRKCLKQNDDLQENAEAEKLLNEQLSAQLKELKMRECFCSKGGAKNNKMSELKIE